MKYCPNPVCPYRRRHGKAGEFLDHARVCADCGITLVDESALGSEETAHAVSAWHAERIQERVAESQNQGADYSNGRVDISTGIALIGLSIALMIVSFFAARSVGSGRYFVAGGPLAYGIIRLNRGLEARQRAKLVEANRPSETEP
jgi:hypothetical protein